MAFTIAINITGDERDYERAVEEARRQTDRLGNDARRTAEQAESSFNRWKSSVVSLRGAVGGLLTLFAGRQILQFAGQFIEAGSQVEQYRVRLVALSGSQAAANAQFEKFTEIAATTPFELKDVVAAATTLEAFGANAERTLKPVADLAAFMGVNIPEAAAAFGRAFAAGAGAADILREQGVLTLVQLRTGVDDLTKLSLPEFRRALIDAMVDPAGRIEGTTNLLANTWVGAVSNMKDAWFQFQSAIAESGFLEVLTTQIRTATKLMQEFGTAIGAGFDLGTASASKLQQEIEFNQRRLEQIERSGILGRLLSPLVGTAEEARLRILDAQLALDELGGAADVASGSTDVLNTKTKNLTRSLEELKTASDVVSQLLASGGETGARIAIEQGRVEQGFIDERLKAEEELIRAISGQNDAIEKQRPLLQQNANEAERLITGVSGIVQAAISGTLNAADVGRRVLSGLADFAIQQISSILGALFSGGRGGGGSLTGVAGAVLPAALGSLGGTGGSGLSGIVANIGSGLSNLTGIASLSGLGSLGGSLPLLGNAAPLAGTAASSLGPALAGVTSIPVVGLAIAAIASAIITIIDTSRKQLTGGGIGIVGSILGASGVGNDLANRLGAQPRSVLQAGIQNFASNFIFPGAGLGLGLLFNSLGIFGPAPDPRVSFSGGVGVGRDPTTGLLSFDDILLDQLEKRDLGQGFADKVSKQVVQILEQTADGFGKILGVFPAFVVQKILPAIEASNRTLETLFNTLTFSERGPNTIAQELKRFANRQAQAGFFIGTRGIIGAAAAESISTAGLSPELAALAEAVFPGVPEGFDLSDTRQGRFPRVLRDLGGLQFPRKRKDIPAFLEALQGFTGFTAGLAGAGPFITEADVSIFERELASVLGTTNGNEFTAAVAGLSDKVNPILAFVKQASEQSEDLFARSLTAAIEAANESQAKRAFLQSFGTGIRSTVLGGLEEAFLASAQFDELLAPAQRTIRDFLQQSLASGEPPDLAAFRSAILPAIEAATNTAVDLAPLAAEINVLGRELTNSVNTALALGGSGPLVVIENLNVDQNTDVHALGESLGQDIARKLLSSTLS